MAIVVNNDLTRGLRGRFGKWFVFRLVRGKTIASHAPRKPDPLKQSAAQRQTRTTFKEAAAWAVRILLDPGKKQYYADLAKTHALPNAYTAAVREYMRGEVTKRMDGQFDYSISSNREPDMEEQCSSLSSSSSAMHTNALKELKRKATDFTFIKKVFIPNQNSTLPIGKDDVWQIGQNLMHLSNKDPAPNFSNILAYPLTI